MQCSVGRIWLHVNLVFCTLEIHKWSGQGARQALAQSGEPREIIKTQNQDPQKATGLSQQSAENLPASIGALQNLLHQNTQS